MSKLGDNLIKFHQGPKMADIGHLGFWLRNLKTSVTLTAFFPKLSFMPLLKERVLMNKFDYYKTKVIMSNLPV